MIEEMLSKFFPGFEYRRNQKESIIEIIEAIADPKIKYIILSAPTGSGKSWIARQVAEIYNQVTTKHALFLTKTISLQNQYIEDFPEVKKLMSASNYECHVDHPVPIPPSLKHHDGCKFTKFSGECHYAQARLDYMQSRFKILNYAFFLYGLKHYNIDGLLIADEAHNLEESILDILQCEVNLSNLQMAKTDDIELSSFLPNFKDLKEFTTHDAQAVIEFLDTSMQFIDELIAGINETLENTQLDSQSIMKVIESKLEPLQSKMQRFGRLKFTLNQYIHDSRDSWYVEETSADNKKIFTLKPIFIPKSYHKMIFGGVDKVLLMSATAERVIDGLKLPRDQCKFISSPYIFDLEKRPVYALNNLPSLNRSTFDSAFPEYVKALDGIISQFDEDTNILIHSVSYKNAEKIKELSQYKRRILIPDSEQIRDIKNIAGGGKILVSPSMTEGIDLANGLAKVQIFIKVPYLFLGDEWVVMKKDMDDGWYDYSAMRTIIQGSGRGIRGPNDSADTIIMDPSFRHLYRRISDKVPEWFQNTIKFV